MSVRGPDVSQHNLLKCVQEEGHQGNRLKILTFLWDEDLHVSLHE